MNPRLLDLFCGGGGAAMGYSMAGFDVVGVDIVEHEDYPFEFHQGDALTWPLEGFDAIHASPPCQGYSELTEVNGDRRRHRRLIPEVRRRLESVGGPYVIENVAQAKRDLRDPLQLCGSSFGLDVRRHRLFECGGFEVLPTPCDHGWQTPRFPVPDKRYAGQLSCVVAVYGNRNYAGDLHVRQRAMGIDWLDNKSLTQAIPPAYTQHIGLALRKYLEES